MKDNLEKLFMRRDKVSALEKDNKYLPYIEELSRMVNNLTPIKIGIVLSHSLWAKEESSKAGTRDSQV